MRNLEKQQAVLAEACGWTIEDTGSGKCWHLNGICSEEAPPNFPNDLNAVAEAERGILTTREEWEQYSHLLTQLVPYDFRRVNRIIGANASQRTEALCQIIEERKARLNSPQPLSTIGTSGAGEGYKQHLASLSPH